MPGSELTSAQLAERTGVAPGTLRVWQNRHGFPAARRPAGTAKRYTDADVEQVRSVIAARRSGLTLAAAIQLVRGTPSRRSLSIFAALREARPDLPVRVYPKSLVVALSHAIEDEQAARAPGGILIGSFQQERHYRASERRWRELSRTADLAVVLADFQRLADRAPGPIEVPLESAHPQEREWTVIVHSRSASACLAGWEIPSARPVPDAERRFELVWSCDPGTAHAAMLATARMLETAAPQIRSRIPASLMTLEPGSLSNQRFSDDLTARAFAYLSVAAVDSASVVRDP